METETRQVSFLSRGVPCAGRMYLPPELPGGTGPCLVMAHGATGTVSLGLDGYARRFAAAGMVVLAFDYRRFGGSGGTPRQVIRVHEQLDDWRAAVRFARDLPEVDPDRVALWGTSLSGGHVVVVAAADPAVRAVVSQLSFQGIDLGRRDPRPHRTTLLLLRTALRDAAGGLVGRPPVPVPVLGRPGEVALFTEAGDAAAARALAADAPDWRNEMAARSVLSLALYQPGRLARRVAVPLLVCVADDDVTTSTRLALRAARDAPQGEVRRYPGGHFAAYTGEVFETMVRDEVDFLVRHLQVSGGEVTGSA